MGITLIRHGETDWNVEKKIQGATDTNLNELGIKQAHELAEIFATSPKKYVKIYTSKLKRAKNTAEIIAERLNIECEVKEGLEEINLGVWEGISWKQVAADYPKEYSIYYRNRRYAKPSQGESYQDVLERFVPALKDIAELHNEEVLVVSHSGTIVPLLALLHNKPFDSMWNYYKLGNADTVELSNAEITNIKL